MTAEQLEAHLSEVLDLGPCKLISLAGGDAASAWRLTTETGTLFVKTTPPPSPFAAEALGLEILRKSRGVRVPEVLHHDDHCLVLEWLELGAPGKNFQERLGQQLAMTHRHRESSYGFDLDHVIGLTPQKNLPRHPNTSETSWSSFWWSYRLEPMIHRLKDSDLASDCGKLESRVDTLLKGTGAEPCLLHGDLWGETWRPIAKEVR